MLDKYRGEVEKSYVGLAQYESIKKFRLVHNMWTVESGELTPTLKEKRKVIMVNLKTVIDSMF